jgi:hypothetical protein
MGSFCLGLLGVVRFLFLFFCISLRDFAAHFVGVSPHRCQTLYCTDYSGLLLLYDYYYFIILWLYLFYFIEPSVRTSHHAYVTGIVALIHFNYFGCDNTYRIWSLTQKMTAKHIGNKSDNTLKINVSTTTQEEWQRRVDHEGSSWKNEEKLDWA